MLNFWGVPSWKQTWILDHHRFQYTRYIFKRLFLFFHCHLSFRGVNLLFVNLPIVITGTRGFFSKKSWSSGPVVVQKIWIRICGQSSTFKYLRQFIATFYSRLVTPKMVVIVRESCPKMVETFRSIAQLDMLNWPHLPRESLAVRLTWVRNYESISRSIG